MWPRESSRGSTRCAATGICTPSRRTIPTAPPSRARRVVGRTPSTAPSRPRGRAGPTRASPAPRTGTIPRLRIRGIRRKSPPVTAPKPVRSVSPPGTRPGAAPGGCARPISATWRRIRRTEPCNSQSTLSTRTRRRRVGRCRTTAQGTDHRSVDGQDRGVGGAVACEDPRRPGLRQAQGVGIRGLGAHGAPSGGGGEGHPSPWPAAGVSALDPLHALAEAPYTATFGETRKVSWSSTISFGGVTYSVPHTLADETVWVRVDGEEIVVVHCAPTGPVEVARHQRSTPGHPMIDDAHYPPRPTGPLGRQPQPPARPRPSSSPSARAPGCSWSRPPPRARHGSRPRWPKPLTWPDSTATPVWIGRWATPPPTPDSRTATSRRSSPRIPLASATQPARTTPCSRAHASLQSGTRAWEGFGDNQ